MNKRSILQFSWIILILFFIGTTLFYKHRADIALDHESNFITFSSSIIDRSIDKSIDLSEQLLNDLQLGDYSATKQRATNIMQEFYTIDTVSRIYQANFYTRPLIGNTGRGGSLRLTELLWFYSDTVLSIIYDSENNKIPTQEDQQNLALIIEDLKLIKQELLLETLEAYDWQEIDQITLEKIYPKIQHPSAKKMIGP